MGSSETPAKVPIIDLSNPDSRLASHIAAACADWGFFQLVNHGLPAEMVQQALRVSSQFFAVPNEQKQAFSRRLDSPWGYYDRELTKNLRDCKEIFDFSLQEDMAWPAQPRELRGVLSPYARHCHQLAMRLVSLAAQGLGLSADRMHREFQPRHSSFTRLNYYPLPGHLPKDAGPLGISRHTDAGALTILLQDEVGGLQVERDGRWHDVAVLPGALTINVGDMLQVWSNDSYSAPLHRVLASDKRHRFSIAYFLNPGYHSVVAPLVDTPGQAKYSPISWREFRHLRAQGDYADYGEEVQITHYRRDGAMPIA